jgi:hypothetical protein
MKILEILKDKDKREALLETIKKITHTAINAILIFVLLETAWFIYELIHMPLCKS